MQKVNIFWHRRDLRVHDNTGLYYALKEGKPVVPIFIFDKNILDELDDQEDARVAFIHEYLEKTAEHYAKAGSELQVFYGQPIEVFQSLVDK